MFKPKFTYTNKMVKILTQISSSREVILNSPLIPKWEISLRKEAIIRSAHYSTSIEGNKLTLEQVNNLAEGRKIMASRKDKQEVLNYLRVLENLDKLVKDKIIKEKNILNIHKKLTKNTLENPEDCGRYRTRYVIVGNKFTGEVIFKPPVNKDVPKFINDLIVWLNSNKINEYDPVIAAGIAHYEFVRIHPFIDGNGRTARVLAALILYLQGFDTKSFFCLDDYYDSDRQAYYKALQSVNPKTINITGWLEYFVEGVAVSISNVKQRVIRLSSERLRKSKHGQIALTERQMSIIEFINNTGKITNRDVRGLFKLSDEGALKEIKKLINLDVIRKHGKGRSQHYILQ